ncbi:amino acid ABC transporter substrate-binding protein [Pelagibacterium nitratireducens]|jgi:general L-amino acid transport system substrate-binding protein|uniref:Amino acid ABC transporter substrate-binding protein n=1 Tax=Pelagibacterium nitratireducens TaxID=1046114 RepID=A0ABZ2HZV1_9HYPH|nr:amino acid ABC transporter substrate-binding protein [Pelagibacterium sp.]|tara:strand:+ start:7563 stop:8582 length:1020 start_codon:yes stop_codon:yes gene_type:complete
MKKQLITCAVAAAVATTSSAAFAQTLDEVMERGYLQCGVTEGVPGFSFPDENNNWTGLEVDFCRGMAAAIFGDAEAVRYTPLTSTSRFESLANGNVDVLSRTTTWTMTRDTDLGLSFTGTMFYDGQGFIVGADAGVTSALDLSGAAVCVEAGTTTELNLADYFAANGMDLSNAVVFVTRDEVTQAYLDGRCDAYTTDSSALAAERSQFPTPSDHIILPEIISKEPLGPVVRAGDTQWFNIAKWTLFTMVNAEELGVTSENVDDMLGSENPSILRLLGVEGDFGTPIGLSTDWGYNIISQVGNYGESYEAHVGPDTPLGLERGLNALWNDGGIMYAPPVR